ncbi:hypothetical protein [Blastopirellula marina]|uniref:Uncharacterized protein n=1 Tax=Blastopirellula marina DSM 3645 TaxID=314230 RepID=A3ZZ47_9BACT|nr:hypothetical protein [Blastopirellula marina]EAQ78228.1 hypothetical protein DSM3645_15665 [Blastopirellula marina DSM 3645]
MNDLSESSGEEIQSQPHLSRETASARFRVSRTRLILAVALAPLPLWLIDPNQGLFGVCYVISSVTLFGAILWFRARDIPFLNLTLSSCTATFLFLHTPGDRSPGLAFLALLVIPVVGLLRWIGSRGFRSAAGATQCVWVLYSAVFPYAYFNVATLELLYEAGLAPIPSPTELLACSLMRVFVGLFLVANLYWAATDRREALDQRSGRGVCYEATMLVLPYATLIAFVVVLRSQW